MPNGGTIDCVECTYNRERPGWCDVHGIETSGHILCRTFRYPGQSHRDARIEFPNLHDLNPGIVYSIDITGAKPLWKIVPVD